MKFNCDAIPEKIRQRRRSSLRKALRWKRVFAIVPVEVGVGDCRWLEFVERRKWLHPLFRGQHSGVFNYVIGAWGYEYKEATK